LGKGWLNRMIVDFTALLQGEHQFTVTLNPALWQSRVSDGQLIGLEKPVVAQLTVSKDRTEYTIQGRVSGVLRGLCGRCLEAYVQPLKPDFTLVVSSSSAPSDKLKDVELSEEDFMAASEHESEVDLQELVMEQIFLSLPIGLLCGEDCLGLCPDCGVNLNKNKCNCQKHSGHPAFSKLKALKFEKE